MMKILKWFWRRLNEIGEKGAELLLQRLEKILDAKPVNDYRGVPFVIIVESDGKITAFRSKLNLERANESARKLIIAFSSPATNWERAPVKFSNLKMTAVKKDDLNTRR